MRRRGIENVPLQLKMVTEITTAQKMSTLAVVDAGMKRNAGAKAMIPIIGRLR